jgi:diguanylate cyclase (GGDEF)-like protein
MSVRSGLYAASRVLRRIADNKWTRACLAMTARLSISDRLTIAFGAVAILAVAANLVVEHGTTTLVTIIKPPAASPPPLIVREFIPLPQPVPAAAPEEPVPAARKLIDEHPVIDALQDFERLVVRRTTTRTPQDAPPLDSEARRLTYQADHFLERTAANDQGIRHRVSALISDATALVHAAQARRELENSYSTHFDNLDAQMQTALDNSWKIFGRVIARQSLVALGRALDDIRRSSSTLIGSRRVERATLDELAGAQSNFATALERNSTSLERSQAPGWMDDVRHNLSLLKDDTRQLAALYDAATPSLDAFQSNAQALEASLQSLAQSARVREARAVSARAPRHPQVAPRELAQLQTVQVSAVRKALPALTVAAPSPSPHTRVRLIIGALSVAVLLLVFVVSAATVRSIARPIRAFMKVTERLATGDLQVRFARSGVRELDVLAQAFNRMAEKLAVAQAVTLEHQAHLEFSVHERTRELQHLALHDPLTGLPNRRQLLSHLEASLREAEAAGSPVAVFFLDLDNFKNLNDSMGHAFGDQVLRAVAERLREASGAGFAARLGGDEFTVICEGDSAQEMLSNIGEQLVAAFQKPLVIEGRELLVSASVGVSVYPQHERDPGALMRAADAALFQAKSLGRSRLSVFSHDLLENASVKFRTEQGLRRAVEKNELELLFQPEVRFDSLNVKLVEALLRWRLPDGRYAVPGEFLSVAEESGLITAINEWVLRMALERCAQWHHGPWPEARVAVNITARQLLDARFVLQLAELLTEYRLPPRCIEIELTETVLQTGPVTVQTLKQLREIGVSVALDDFGSGYSSLASLEQLPLTRVKLDRSLIASIDSSSRSLAIARAIIGLCAGLGLEVTAEGIERPEQLALLLAFPNLTLQGYLLAQPLHAEALPGFLAAAPQQLQALLLSTPPAEVVVSPAARLAASG